MNKIIVTGGAGFIGYHLVPHLLSSKYRVLVIDNLYSGRREYVPPAAEFLKLDLAHAHETAIFDAVRGFNPDAVIHLAAVHYIPHCIANPAETFLANVRSTEVLTRALCGLATKKLIGVSSADVYPPLDKIHAETDASAPNNPYGMSKLLLEEIIANTARTNPALSCVVLRLFNVYGAGDTNPHVIPRILGLLRSASNEIRIGALETTRDFVHVEDVVKAIRKALTHDPIKYDVFNVGTGRATPIWGILSMLMEAAGDWRPVIRDKNLLRSYDRPSLTSDITKIRQHLHWQPTVRLEDGLLNLVQQAL
jgi:UDP-glucose 4-epimerase